MTRRRGEITSATGANTAFELAMARALAEEAETRMSARREEHRRFVEAQRIRHVTAALEHPEVIEAQWGPLLPPSPEDVQGAIERAASWVARHEPPAARAASLRDLLETLGVAAPEPAPPPEPRRRPGAPKVHAGGGACGFCIAVDEALGAGWVVVELPVAIGSTPVALERRLARHGRHDLANTIARHFGRHRQGTS